MNKLLLIVLVVAVILSGCGTGIPPSDADWCYFWNFRADNPFTVSIGTWQEGVGYLTNDHYLLQVSGTAPNTVNPLRAEVGVSRADSTGDVSVASDGTIFGLSAVGDGTIPSAISSGTVSFQAENADTIGINLNVSISASDTIAVQELKLYGRGDNPFGTSNCVDYAPSETPNVPTNTAFPTDTRTPTPAPTNTPTHTLTPSNTPTGTITPTMTNTPADHNTTYYFSTDNTADPTSVTGDEPESTYYGAWCGGSPTPIRTQDSTGFTWHRLGREPGYYVTDFSLDVCQNNGGSTSVYVDGSLVTTQTPSSPGFVTYHFSTPVDLDNIRITSQNPGYQGFRGIELTYTWITPTYTPTPTATVTNTPGPTNTPLPTNTRPPNVTWTPRPTTAATATRTPTPNPTYIQATGTLVTPSRTPAIIATGTARPPTATPNLTTTAIYGGTATALAETGTPVETGTPGLGTGTPGIPGPMPGDGTTAYCIVGAQFICDIVAYGSNALERGGQWLTSIGTTVNTVTTAWKNTAATAPPSMPQCHTLPEDSEVCAIYYILTFTVLSGPIGSLIIPIAVVVIDLLILFTSIRLGRAILSRIAEVRKAS